jgi:hypothetical protein
MVKMPVAVTKTAPILAILGDATQIEMILKPYLHWQSLFQKCWLYGASICLLIHLGHLEWHNLNRNVPIFAAPPKEVNAIKGGIITFCIYIGQVNGKNASDKDFTYLSHLG